MKSFLLSHPFGSPFAEHAAHALLESGRLAAVISSFSLSLKEHAYLARFLPQNIKDLLARRDWIPQGAPYELHPLREILRALCLRSPLATLASPYQQSLSHWVAQSIDRASVKALHTYDAHALYAYEDAALHSFREAKKLGILCCYDLPIPHHEWRKKIFEKERELFPQYGEDLSDLGISPASQKQKDEELALADHVIVASPATRASVLAQGILPSRAHEVAYGVDLNNFIPGSPSQQQTFRVLFVGRIGLRKGVHHLLAAWRQLALPQAELHLLGPIDASTKLMQDILATPGIQLPGPQTMSALVRHYQEAHLLVFPSLVEGFGMVVLEALACGTPVLTTEQTCGAQCIENGINGWLVQAGDIPALAQKIEAMYRNKELWFSMRSAARRSAERYTWQAYEDKLLAVLGCM